MSKFDGLRDYANNVVGFGNYGVMYDNGNSGTSKTINWNNGNVQKITMTGNCTLTFTAPTNGRPGPLVLYVYSGAGSFTITWPTINPAGGPTPVCTATASRVDVIAGQYDGTNYWLANAMPSAL